MMLFNMRFIVDLAQKLAVLQELLLAAADGLCALLEPQSKRLLSCHAAGTCVDAAREHI
jgi:hypothetical protein